MELVVDVVTSAKDIINYDCYLQVLVFVVVKKEAIWLKRGSSMDLIDERNKTID